MIKEFVDRKTELVVIKADKLRYWFKLLCIGGQNTKKLVREEIKKELGEELKFYYGTKN